LVQPGDEPQYKNAKDQHSVVGSGQQERISPDYFLKPHQSEQDEQMKAAIATLKKHGLAHKKKKQNNDRDDTDSESFYDNLSMESEEENEVPDHYDEQDLLEESTLQVEKVEPTTERLRGGGDKPSGFRIVDVDAFRKSIQMANDHGRNCCGNLEFKKRSKRGFAATDMFLCDKCGKEFETYPNSKPADIKTGGRKFEELNLRVAHSMFQVGISPTKMTEFCAELGMDAPTPSVLHREFQFVYCKSVKITTEQLRLNRIEHNRLARLQTDYAGDIQFVDNKGNKRSIARGPISTDGGGTTRAYNHRIKGDQHILIIVSLLTGKPILMIIDQNKCGACSHVLSKHCTETGKSPWHVVLGEVDLRHRGKCYRASKHSPAVAEEYAMEKAAEMLIDTDDDDEAIFGDEIVYNGHAQYCCHNMFTTPLCSQHWQYQTARLLSIAFVEIGFHLVIDKALPSVGYHIKMQRIKNQCFWLLMCLAIECNICYILVELIGWPHHSVV
jgi:hypothetical protein